MLSVAEIRNVKFTKAMGGYKQEEVDVLLDRIEADYIQFERAFKEYKAKIDSMNKEIETLKSSQNSIQNVLLSAQKLADQIVDEAKQKSEEIINNAQSSIEVMTAREKELATAFELKAQERKNNLQKELDDMVKTAQIKADSMKAAAEDSVARQQLLYDKLKMEMSAFKAALSAKYKEHLEMLKTLPDILDVFRRSGDVEAVAFCHFLDFLEGADLIADFLRGANVFFVHHVSGSDHFMVFLLFLDQIVDAVERCSSVVTDDSAAAVSVRKSRNEAEMSDLTHFVGVCLKNAVVVRREVVEHIVNFRRQCNAVLLHFFSDHLDAAERANTSLKRFVCLQSDDDILARNDVAGAECVHAHDAARVNLQRTACFALRDQKLVHLVTAFLGSLCRSREETAVTVIRMVV